jgi:murein DD-endopeptidase MepM/ murein hydrolase activator NlpD
MCVNRRPLTRAASSLAAAAALAGTTVALAAAPTAKGPGTATHAARAATAQATAYVRDDGSGNPLGFLTVSGDGSRTGPRTAVSASTAGYKGSATGSARVDRVSLLGGRVTADVASVRATASGGAEATGGKVTNLVVAGTAEGNQSRRAVYDVPGYGRLVVLASSGHGITGLRIKLSQQYGQYPQGTTLRIAFASATASDGAPPPPKPKPPKPKPQPSKPKPHASAPKKPTKPAKPARRKPSRTHVLLTSKGFVFPVYGTHDYTDTFGAFRADTGFHEGNDIFATSGTPVVAVCDGALNRVGTLPISGNRLWDKCTTGDSFFYAHLSAYASDARDGLRVKAGQVIGFVGSTGDAEQTPPHLHFEVHPGDGRAVDPYPFLRAWESHRDVPAAAWVRQNGQPGEQPGTLVVLKDFLSR